MSLSPIDNIAISIQNQPGWEEIKNWSQIRTAWEEIISPQLAVNTRPKSLMRGVLTVTTSSASLAHQLSFQRQMLTKKMFDRLPDSGLIDLRFVPLGVTPDRRESIELDTPDRDLTVVSCPDCLAPAPQWELNRWHTCRFCAIDRGILG
jgi:predicted nucleic acid-binding Zn ribbon protein